MSLTGVKRYCVNVPSKDAATGFTVELEVTDRKLDKSKETSSHKLHFSEFLKIV